MKRETAPSSESAQYILAWRSEDSVESAKRSQSEAQPGSGSSAIPEAARSWRQQSPAQGQYPKILKTNSKGGICTRQQGETCWIDFDRGKLNL